MNNYARCCVCGEDADIDSVCCAKCEHDAAVNQRAAEARKDKRIAELERENQELKQQTAELTEQRHELANALAYDKREWLDALESESCKKIAELERERDALAAALTPVIAALELLYGEWENGVDSYEDVEEMAGYLGKAFELSSEQENAILHALTSVGVETSFGKAELDPQAILDARLSAERKELIDRIAATIRDYPNAGGDTTIMAEVDKLVAAERKAGAIHILRVVIDKFCSEWDRRYFEGLIAMIARGEDI